MSSLILICLKIKRFFSSDSPSEDFLLIVGKAVCFDRTFSDKKYLRKLGGT
jgi:hypothetical protein